MISTDNCPICGILNSSKLPGDFFSEIEKKTFIDKVFSGAITVYNLDVNQYLKMSRKMSESIVNGFGSNNTKQQQELMFKLVQNGYVFNAAKQYQLVRQINQLKENNFDAALEIFDKYNVVYFEAELDSAE
jgi:hypothetical protein